jgi:integrase
MAYLKGISNPTIQKDGFIIAHGFRIKKYKSTSGKYRYQVDLGIRGGKHLRPSFPTLDEAKNEAQLKKIEADQLGYQSLSFTNSMREDATKAYQVLKPFGITLAKAAQYYAQHEAEVDYDMTINGLMESYLKYAKENGIRDKTYQGYQAILNDFRDTFADRSIKSITHLDLDKYLSAWNASPRSRASRRTTINTFFRYANEEGFIEINPMAKVKKQSQIKNKKAPAICKVNQVIVMIEHSANVESKVTVVWKNKKKYTKELNNPYDLFLYLALGFFSGIRPDEILRLQWKDIDLSKKHIVIPAEKAKERKARIVELYPNLLKILNRYRKMNAVNELDPVISIGTSALTYRRRKLMKELGMEWEQDVMRHTFATYHIAKFGTDKTRRLLGHTVDRVMFDFYVGYAENAEEDAEIYFNHSTKIKNLNTNNSLMKG